MVLIKTAGTMNGMDGMDGMGGSSSMMGRVGSMVGGGARLVVEGRGGVRLEGERTTAVGRIRSMGAVNPSHSMGEVGEEPDRGRGGAITRGGEWYQGGDQRQGVGSGQF